MTYKKDPNADFHTDMIQFEDWLEDTKLVENTDKSMVWYKANKETFRQKYEKYWSVKKSTG